MSVVSDDKDKKVDNNEKPESVSYETHQRLLDQRKRDKQRADAAEAERDRLKQESEDAEKDRLTKQNEFKTLYETEKAKREKAESTLSDLSKNQVLASKQNALKAELGGIKQEYLSFAKLEEIVMGEDGTPDMESVKKVANQFRKDHISLLPTKEGASLPNEAARGTGLPLPPAPVDLSKKSPKELAEMYAAMGGIKANVRPAK